MENVENSDKLMQYPIDDECHILKLAVGQMNIHVFVYDLLLEKIYFFQSPSLPFGTLSENNYSVDDIINLAIFDKEGDAMFRKIFEDTHAGLPESGAIIKTLSDSNPCWYHVMMLNCFNENGDSFRAIGTIQDVSTRIETELRYSKEKQFRLAMMTDANRVYEVNVSRDRFMALTSVQDTTDCDNWNLYTQSMADLCKNRVYQEDWSNFLRVASRENLLQGFAQGITEFYCEYRTVDENNQKSWSSSATHLLRDPLSNDIKGFIYVKDIDEQKKQEIALYQQAECDPLTGVYNRRTAERLITQTLLSSKANHIHGFLSIDIDDFKFVNDSFGHLVGDALLQQLSAKIGCALRNDDILARMGGDEFVVFLNDTGNMSHILHVAERLCLSIQEISLEEAPNYHPTISIGIATYPNDGNTFRELYKKSDQSLYQVKQNGKNHVSVFNSSEKHKK